MNIKSKKKRRRKRKYKVIEQERTKEQKTVIESETKRQSKLDFTMTFTCDVDLNCDGGIPQEFETCWKHVTPNIHEASCTNYRILNLIPFCFKSCCLTINEKSIFGFELKDFNDKVTIPISINQKMISKDCNWNECFRFNENSKLFLIAQKCFLFALEWKNDENNIKTMPTWKLDDMHLVTKKNNKNDHSLYPQTDTMQSILSNYCPSKDILDHVLLPFLGGNTMFYTIKMNAEFEYNNDNNDITCTGKNRLLLDNVLAKSLIHTNHVSAKCINPYSGVDSYLGGYLPSFEFEEYKALANKKIRIIDSTEMPSTKSYWDLQSILVKMRKRDKRKFKEECLRYGGHHNSELERIRLGKKQKKRKTKGKKRRCRTYKIVPFVRHRRRKGKVKHKRNRNCRNKKIIEKSK